MGTPFDAGPIQTPTAPKSGGSPFDSAPARQLSPADQKAANDLFNKYANMPRLDATQPGGSQAAVERPASPSPGVEFPIPLPGGGSFNFHTSEGSTLPSGRGLVARIGNQARQQDAETAAAKEGTLTRYWGAMGSRLPNFPASVLRIGTLAARLMGNDDAADEMEGYIGPSTRAMQAQPRTAGEKAFAAGTGALMYAGVPLGAGAFAGQSAIDTANEAKAQGASNLTALGAGGVAGAGTYGALHLTGRVGNSIPGIKAARDAEGNLLPWDKILDNPKTWGEIAKGIAINGGETSGLMSLAKFADNLYAKSTYAPHQDLRDGLLESAVVGFGFGMGHMHDKIDMARVKDAVLSHPDGPIEVGKQATDALESGENLVRIAQTQVDSAPDAKARADAQDLLAKANKQVDVFGKVSRTANYLLKTKEGMAAQARANARPKIDPNADILEPPEPGADTGATGLNVELPKPVPTLGMRGENRTPGMTSDDRIVGTGDAKYGSAVTGISGDQNIGATPLPGPPAGPSWETQRMQQIEQRIADITKNPTSENAAEHIKLVEEYLKLAAQTGIKNRLNPPSLTQPTLGENPSLDTPAAYYPPGTGPRGPIPMPGPPPVEPGTPEIGMQVPPKGATPMPGPPPPDARQTRMGEIEKQLDTVRQNPGAMSGPDHINLALKYADLIGQGVKPTMVAPPAGPPPTTEKPKAISISETQANPQESAGPSMTRRVGGENVSVPLSETGQTRLENAQKDFKAEMQEVDQMKPESTEGPDTTKQTRAELRAQAAAKLAEEKKQIQIQQEANEAGTKTNSEILSKEATQARARKRKGETGALFLGRDKDAEPPMTAAELWKFVKDALPNPEDLHLSNAIFAQMQRNGVVTKGVAQRYLHPADLLIEQANKTVQLPDKPTNKQMDFGTYQLESQRHADMVAGSEAGRILGDRYSDDTKTRARDYYDAINAGLKPDLSKIGPMELAAIRDLRPLMENQGKLFESQRIRKGADPEDAIANDALIPRRVEDNGKGELPPGNKQTVNGAMRVKGRSEMNRSMVAGTDADTGERLVMSLKSTPKKVFYMEDGVRRELETSNMQKSATVWKDGAPIGEAMRDPNAKPGEAADYIWKDEQGNKHTLKVGQATTNEIEAHTGMKYRSDPFGTTIDSIVDLNNVRRTLDVLDQLKQHGIAEKVPESGEVPDGYLKIDLKNLNGYMAPKGVADSLNALHERITAAAKLPNPAMQIARMISVNLGFLNPSVHMPNMFDHFMGGGGVTKWAQPGAYDRVAQAFDTAAYMARDGLTRNRILAMGATVNPMASKLAIDALNAGMPMMNATPETSAVLKSYIETIGATIKENPSKWGFLGDKPQEVMDRVQGAINAVGDKVWMVDNMARLTHVLDYADAHKLDIGNPDQLKQAVQEVGRSSYVDYRIPSEVFGSRAVSKALQSDLMLFMRYHYGAMSLLKNKVLDAVNPAALKDQSVPANQLARARMKKDYDKLAMLAIMNAAIYPLLSQGVKAVTGDEESEYRKGGTSKLATDIGRTVTGQQPPERLANGFFTLAPWIRAPLETAFTNKNLFTNRKVISQADLYKTFDPESSAEDRLAAMGRFAGNVGTEVMSNVGPLSQWQAATYNRPGEEKDTLDKARHFAGALLGGRQVNEGAIESLPKRMNQEYVKEGRRLAKEQ